MPEHTPALSPADVDRLVTVYLKAIYRWAHDGDWHDLNIGLPAPGLELLHPDVRGFGLLSAWNPLSRVQDDARNRSADLRLEAELRERGLAHIPAFSSAANRSWREPGWVILDIDVATIDALARHFGQLGALWWPRGGPVRLRMHAARPATVQPDRAVDWLE